MIDFLNLQAESGVVILGTINVKQKVNAEFETASGNPSATTVIMISDVFGKESRIGGAESTP